MHFVTDHFMPQQLCTWQLKPQLQQLAGGINHSTAMVPTRQADAWCKVSGRQPKPLVDKATSQQCHQRAAQPASIA
jgi:hypothetical protein